MCGLSTVVTPAGASLTMYREIRSYANSIWDDNNNNNNAGESRNPRSRMGEETDGAASSLQKYELFDVSVTTVLLFVTQWSNGLVDNYK